MSSRIAGILVSSLTAMSLASCHNGSGVPAQFSPVQQAPRVEDLVAHNAGVDVVHTRTGGFLIRIRGVTTFGRAREPLYVIDGNPIPVDPSVGIDWLRPEDIARIDVLKYPAETTVYGPRGANGVILITTNRSR